MGFAKPKIKQNQTENININHPPTHRSDQISHPPPSQLLLRNLPNIDCANNIDTAYQLQIASANVADVIVQIEL